MVSAPYRCPRRRALEFIARSPHGRTEQVLRGEGLGIMTLVHMVRAGLVSQSTHTDGAVGPNSASLSLIWDGS